MTASPALAVHASSHSEENSKSPPKLVPREIPRPGPLRYPRPTQMRRANDLASTPSCCGMRSAVLPDWAPVDPQPRRGASGVQHVTWATSKPPTDHLRHFTLDQNNPPRALWSRTSHGPPYSHGLPPLRPSMLVCSPACAPQHGEIGHFWRERSTRESAVTRPMTGQTPQTASLSHSHAALPLLTARDSVLWGWGGGHPAPPP